MAQVQRFLASRRWKSHLEINRLLSSPEGQRALASVPPRSRMEKPRRRLSTPGKRTVRTATG